jgi:hypothetical protein
VIIPILADILKKHLSRQLLALFNYPRQPPVLDGRFLLFAALAGK